MKKLISVLLILVMLMALAVSISADDAAKTRLYNAAKDACPTAYRDSYLGIAQNVLNQIDVTSDQADQVIALVEEGKAYFTKNKGPSLDAYTKAEINKAVDLFERACEILFITTKIDAAKDAEHDGDIIVSLYYNAEHIASIDGDDIRTSSGVTGGGATLKPSHTIEFEVYGGSGVMKIRVREGGIIEEPETPVKEGFVFGGWYADEALTIEFDFSQPITSKITLHAKWIPEDEVDDGKEPVETPWENPYKDVDADAWYYEAIKYADENGLMNGIAANEFDPDGKLTRGMFVTMLHRIENTPKATKVSGFDDVASGAWYYDAVNWAAENNIVNGVSPTEYKPNDYITREQMAAIIFRFAQYKGVNAVTLAENLHFDDADQISEYAIPAMNWAAGLRIIRGYGDGNVGPKDNTTRAQAALVLMRMRNNNIF